MLKFAYELGARRALAALGLEKTAIDPAGMLGAGAKYLVSHPVLLGGVIGGGIGAASGAVSAGEGNRLRGALGGGLVGAGAGALAGAMGPHGLYGTENAIRNTGIAAGLSGVAGGIGGGMGVPKNKPSLMDKLRGYIPGLS